MKRILITGSREWTNRLVLRGALIEAIGKRDAIVIHGGARGADMMAESICEELGIPTEIFIAKWGQYGRSAGHIRNKEMIDTKPDVVLAFPIGRSPGTRGCMAMATKAGIPVIHCGY